MLVKKIHPEPLLKPFFFLLSSPLSSPSVSLRRFSDAEPMLQHLWGGRTLDFLRATHPREQDAVVIPDWIGAMIRESLPSRPHEEKEKREQSMKEECFSSSTLLDANYVRTQLICMSKLKILRGKIECEVVWQSGKIRGWRLGMWVDMATSCNWWLSRL